MNGLRVSWAQYTLPFSLPLLPMGVMGNRPITSPTYTWLTMANQENSKLTGALRNAPQKIYPPQTFLGLTRKHLSDLVSENSSNHPPVNSLASSTSSCTCFPDTNTNPYFYICIFLQYNHLRTIYTYYPAS